jgi:hypothetical protein
MSDGHRRSFAECPGHRITVLGAFSLTSDGAGVPLSVDSRRIVAYLAVHRRPQPRAGLAADLWPGVPAEAAARLLTEAVDERPAVDLLCEDILPAWTAPWIAVERERFRQLRLASLEEISLKLTAAGLHADAVEVAEIAVAAGPSRESARRALIEALLAKGDVVEAVAQYDAFQELLRTSVGPQSAGLEGIFSPVGGWPIRPTVGGYRPVPTRSAVVLPGLRAARPGGAGGPRRQLAGGSVPGR